VGGWLSGKSYGNAGKQQGQQRRKEYGYTEQQWFLVRPDGAGNDWNNREGGGK
jgi:hypothetical protein